MPAAGAAEPRFHGVYGCRAAAVCPTNSVLNTVREIGNVLYRGVVIERPLLLLLVYDGLLFDIINVAPIVTSHVSINY